MQILKVKKGVKETVYFMQILKIKKNVNKMFILK